MTRDLWRVVDDVIIRPIEKAELRVRLEALLRARRLSLQLSRMSTMYEQERNVASRLQAAGLPNAFPEVPGLRCTAFYRPGSDEALIGGDWYDVFRLPDGRVVLTIGDVSGSGLEAAITMGNIRQALRSIAQIHPEPAVMLDAADRTLAIDAAERQVTAFVGVLDPVTSFLTYASAGHPPALLRDAAGDLSELSTFGLPLGIDARVPRASESVAVPPHSLIVLYTDGLTESTRDILEGEARLASAVRSRDVAEALDPAATLRERLLPDGAHDDVAILAMQVDSLEVASEKLHRWTFDAADPELARGCRLELVRVLERVAFTGAATASAEVVYSELLGNVVRYAPGIVTVVLDTSGTAPVLHVLDRGSGFRLMPRLPYDTLSERGRGLYIVHEYVEEFHVSLRRGGGSHASAVLRRGVS